MTTETRRVLDLLAAGRITAADAEELLRALGPSAPSSGDNQPEAPTDAPRPRFIKINVHKPGRDGKRDKDVNVRVPLAILRGGMRLSALIPGFRGHLTTKLHENGVDIDLTKMDAAALESLLRDMREVNIDVDKGDERVRITCE